MTNDNEQWFDTELSRLLEEFDRTGASRIRILMGVATLCLIGVVALSALIGFVIVAGDDATGVFITSLGLLAGPGVLGVVLAYVALVRNHLHYEFAANIIVPFLRAIFDEFRYDSTEGLPEERWRTTDWFPDEIEHATATHRIHYRIDDTDIRLCHLKITPSLSLRNLITGGKSDAGFEGLFAIVEDHTTRDLETPDGDGAMAINDEGAIKIFLPAVFPELRADPRDDVTDTDEVRQYFRRISTLVEFIDRTIH